MAEVSEKQIKRLRNLLVEAETNLLAAKELLISLVGDDVNTISSSNIHKEDISGAGSIVEGVFDGQNMIGSNSKLYPVPANYASKSHLVQGDVLKLTLQEGGKFLFKQIGPIDRRQLVGTLVQREGNYYIQSEGKEYKVLLASVTYFQLKIGSQATISVPANDENTEWAAVEAAL